MLQPNTTSPVQQQSSDMSGSVAVVYKHNSADFYFWLFILRTIYIYEIQQMFHEQWATGVLITIYSTDCTDSEKINIKRRERYESMMEKEKTKRDEESARSSREAKLPLNDGCVQMDK